VVGNSDLKCRSLKKDKKKRGFGKKRATFVLQNKTGVEKVCLLETIRKFETKKKGREGGYTSFQKGTIKKVIEER